MSGRLRVFVRLIFVLLATALPVAVSAAPTPVLVVGTIHGSHRTNPNYSFEHLVQILVRFQPDVVCVEIRPVDFRKVPYLDEMMLATTYGLKRGLRVYPIDWWDEGNPAREERDRFMKTPEFQAKSAREKQMTAESAIARRYLATYGEDERRIARERGYEFFNGDDYNEYIADTYRISMAIYGDSAMNLYYETRNRNMTQLIARAIADNPGRRVVVLTGAEHKHYFDRSLAALPGVEVVRFASLLPLKPVEMDSEIRDLVNDHKATVYFDLSMPEGVDACYSSALVPLVHGPDMDFYPETIPTGNVDKAKVMIDEWGARAPTSTRYRFELGWYHFLKGATSEAIPDLEAVVRKIERIEPARLRPLVFRVLGFCYDLTGQREKAVAEYAKGERLSGELGLPPSMVEIMFASVKAKPYPGIPRK
jgi:hypothetical protein